MATLKCRQCGETYSSCSDALINKEYKSFCCSEECYKAYIKIVLETILSPITVGLIFGFIDSLRRDYNEYYQNLADDYKKGEEND